MIRGTHKWHYKQTHLARLFSDGVTTVVTILLDSAKILSGSTRNLRNLGATSEAR